MTTRQVLAEDSSVAFNLRELIELEAERVQVEQERRIAREREQAERERSARQAVLAAESARRTKLERMRIEAEVAARAETERQARLLAIRLAAEAAAADAHRASQLAPAATVAPERRSRVRTLVLCVLACALGAVVTAGVASGMSRRFALTDQAARLAHQTRELIELRRQLAALHAPPVQRTQGAPIAATPPVPSPLPVHRPLPAPRTRTQRASLARREFVTLDTLGEGDDPIEGLR